MIRILNLNIFQETYVSQLYQKRCWEFFPAGDCFRKQHEEDTEQN